MLAARTAAGLLTASARLNKCIGMHNRHLFLLLIVAFSVACAAFTMMNVHMLLMRYLWSAPEMRCAGRRPDGADSGACA